MNTLELSKSIDILKDFAGKLDRDLLAKDGLTYDDICKSQNIAYSIQLTANHIYSELNKNLDQLEDQSN
jgi:hypothetical protein